jgi:hypothetical protein
MTQLSIGVMLRSRASNAGERVSDALWRDVSKHGAARILRDGRHGVSKTRVNALYAPSSG